MKLNEVKELFEKELSAAKERLEAVGLTATPELECEENEIEGGELEVTSVLASLEVSAPGLSKEDMLYICMSEDPDENGDFSIEDCQADVEDFRANVDTLIFRAEACEDKAEAVKSVCREIDLKIEEMHRAELERMNAAVKKNLKIAITAAVALLAIAAVCILIKLVA